MKKPCIFLMVMLVGIQAVYSQTKTAKLDSFRSEILSKNLTYFSAAGLDDNGHLRLTASENYLSLSSSERSALMDVILKSWQEPLVVVQQGSERELWGWNRETKSIQLVDSWSLNPEPVAKATESGQSGVAKHPWFFYIGGAQQMDSNKNITGALNARVGFFLLFNQLDLAVSLTEQLSGNLEDESASLSTSVGLASKYYFPIKKHNLSPNLGAELAVTIPSGSKISFTPSMLAGVSWFAGPGCFDAGLRIGSSSMLIFGYTLIPKFKSGILK